MTFYSNITALVGIAILLNVVCLSMARERKYNSPPKFLKNLFAGVLGKLLCLGNYAHQVINYLIFMEISLDIVLLAFQNLSGRPDSYT